MGEMAPAQAHRKRGGGSLLRRSSALPKYAEVYSGLVMSVAAGEPLMETVAAAAKSVGLDVERMARGSDPMVA